MAWPVCQRHVAHGSHGLQRRAWLMLTGLVVGVFLNSGCVTTGPLDYVRNGFKVGPNYCRPPAPVAAQWIEARDPNVQSRHLVKDLGPEEREREMQEHHRKSHEKLSAFLKRVLDARQQGRLFQLQLQQGGVFALLGSNEAFLKLKITEEQRRQFTEVVQQMHKKMEATARQAANTGNPEEVRRSMRKLRQDHAAKIEALLSESQKKLWKELLSTALAMDD